MTKVHGGTSMFEILSQKKCTKCGERKAKSEFGKDSFHKDGLRSDCKLCHNETSRKWCEANPNRERERKQKYRKKNSDRERERKKKYRKDNLDKARVHNQSRRARKAGNGGRFTVAEFQDLCNKYNYLCLCCREKKKLEADHVIPVTKGGTSFIDNIQPLCRSCNSSKGTKEIDYRQ
jgi:5-methylcytosine-specific restriction endonuclease McrA